jgi:hypothetical protein
VIDYQEFYWSLARFEPESEFVLHGLQERCFWRVRIGVDTTPKLESKVIVASHARLVEHKNLEFL